MKNKGFLKNEDGAELIEAVLIYPVVFMALAFLLYVGIMIMQYMTINAYAEKAATLAAREVACPGYINMIYGADRGVVENSGAELLFNDVTVENSKATVGSGQLNISYDPSEENQKKRRRPYRYWSKNLLIDDDSNAIKNMLVTMGKKYSLMGTGNITATVTSDNMIFCQYIHVTVEEELPSFGALTFFGIEEPTISVNASCPVNDTDEFIRNTDFAVDVIKTVAAKLGIDVNSMKDKLNEAREKLGKLGYKEEG